MTDPIADMIIRIKNAFLAGHMSVEVPHSNMKTAIADILVKEGYITSSEVVEASPRKIIKIDLRYIGKIPAITDVRRLSKPGRRLYSNVKDIPRALGGYGITIVSTSQGLMTGAEARKKNMGGELICQVW